MRLKPGVELANLQPALIVALMIVNDEYKSIGCELTITSVNDGVHGNKSRHYWGGAFDARTKDVDDAIKSELIESIKAKLGEEFNVLFEDEGEANEHLHVSWRP